MAVQGCPRLSSEQARASKPGAPATRPGALGEYHVNPELLGETLAALQSELLLGCSMVARFMRHGFAGGF